MEKMHVIIAHGYDGDRNEHFLPELGELLEEDGHMVTRVNLRNADCPNMLEWASELLGQLSRNDLRKVLVGHSLGVSAVLHTIGLYLRNNIAGAFHIAGSARELAAFPPKKHNIDPRFYYKNPIPDLIAPRFDTHSGIADACDHFVYAGDNDPWVDTENTEELALALDADVQWFEGGGHLNADTPACIRRKMMDAVRNDVRMLSG